MGGCAGKVVPNPRQPKCISSEAYNTKDHAGNIVLTVQITWEQYCEPCPSGAPGCMRCLEGSPRRTLGCWDVTSCDDPSTSSCGTDLALPDGTCQLPNVRGCDETSGPKNDQCECYTLQPIKWAMNSAGASNEWVHTCGQPIRNVDKDLCQQALSDDEIVEAITQPAVPNDVCGDALAKLAAENKLRGPNDDCTVPGCCIPGGMSPGGGSPIPPRSS